MEADTQPLSGTLVVELAWYLPIAFAGRELARLGARVVRVEPPAGDPLRAGGSGLGRGARGRARSRSSAISRRKPSSRAVSARGPTSCSRASARALPPGSASGLAICRRRSSTARSPASGRRAGTPSGPPTTSTTSAGRVCSRTRPRAPRSRSPTSRPARSAPSRRCSPRSSGAQRTGEGARTVHLDDPPQPRSRRLPARWRRAGADADRRACLLPRLPDRGRAPAHARRPRAEVLRPRLRAARAARARRAAVRRRTGGARAWSSRRRSRSGRLQTGSSRSTARTPASARSRHAARLQPSSAAPRPDEPDVELGQHTAAWRTERGLS